MQHVNWFAATIIAIWLSAAIGTAFSKDSQCFEAALLVAVAMEIGYCIR